MVGDDGFVMILSGESDGICMLLVAALICGDFSSIIIWEVLGRLLVATTGCEHCFYCGR